MKKSYFALLLLLLSSYGCSKDEWYDNIVINDVTAADFENEKLYRYMQVNYDKDGDGIFQKEEILAVKSLLIQEQLLLTNLKGLEKFVALEKLEIEWINANDKIEITNHRLQDLTISRGGMPALNISELPELRKLTCIAWIETPVDLSNNKKLRELTCTVSGVIDLTNNTEIEKIDWLSCITESIDFSKCTKLKHLNLEDARLDSLDISNCINLKYLNINSWYIKKPVNISKNKNLEEIHVNGRYYFTLDITQNPKVKKIHIKDTPDHQPYIIVIGKNQTKPEVKMRWDGEKYEFQYK